jgi:hypothetical protein
MTKNCGSFSQPYGTPWSVIEIDLPFSLCSQRIVQNLFRVDIFALLKICNVCTLNEVREYLITRVFQSSILMAVLSSE